jgi:sugar (pentulose or hexulose) kinase
VEGLACELGRYLAMMATGGVRVERLIMCGKAAASRVTPQIIADATGLPVDCATLPETSSLGAAMLARKLVEPARGLVELSDVMKPPMQRVQPGQGREQAARRFEEYLAALNAAPAKEK